MLAFALILASLPTPSLARTTSRQPAYIPLAAFELPSIYPTNRSYDEVLTPLRAAQAETARLEALEAARLAEEARVAAEAQLAAEAVYVAPTVSYGQPDDFYKAFIYNHESGNRPGAINAYSGACGLGQALPCSKMPCSLSDYACQDAFFTQYCFSRYGSWAGAYSFWLSHSWW